MNISRERTWNKRTPLKGFPAMTKSRICPISLQPYPPNCTFDFLFFNRLGLGALGTSERAGQELAEMGRLTFFTAYRYTYVWTQYTRWSDMLHVSILGSGRAEWVFEPRGQPKPPSCTFTYRHKNGEKPGGLDGLKSGNWRKQ